ncbi:MAG: lysine--tRNA ligase, partial [Caldimonas sp.]
MTEPTPTPPPPADENRLIAERRAKLAAIRSRGVAFPNDFKPRDRALALSRKHGHL